MPLFKYFKKIPERLIVPVVWFVFFYDPVAGRSPGGTSGYKVTTSKILQIRGCMALFP